MHTSFTANPNESISNADVSVDDCRGVTCCEELKTLEKIAAANEKKIKEAKEKYRLALIDNLRCDLTLEEFTKNKSDDQSKSTNRE